MKYLKNEFPLSYGVIVENGECYLGIGDVDAERQIGKFILYDLKTHETLMRFRDVKINANDGDAMNNCSCGISDKGNYFFGDYAQYTDESISGYKIEEYSKENGKLVCTIPITEYFKKHWEDDHRISDICRISEEKLLIAVIDDTYYPGSVVEIMAYDSERNHLEILDKLKMSPDEPKYFFDVHFAEDGRKLCGRMGMDHLLNPAVSSEWEYFECKISDALGGIDIQTCEAGTVNSIDHLDWVETTLTYDDKPGSIFRKGYLKVLDKLSGERLIEATFSRHDGAIQMITEHPDLVAIQVFGKDKEKMDVYFLEHNGSGWYLAEMLKFDYPCNMRYDMNHKTIIVQDDVHSILLQEK